MTIFLSVFATLGAIAVGVVLMFGVHTWRDRRRRRLAHEAAEKRFAARRRGRVIRIGTIVRDVLGREHPWGFMLDCEGKVPAVEVGPNGEYAMAGYTADELLEMVKRRSEFET